MSEIGAGLTHDEVRILIVSSDVMTRGSALGALVASGYTGLQTAESCDVAFQQVAAATASGTPFDMVLIDMSTRGDVYPTLRRLRNAFDPQIIALVARGSVREERTSLSSGADDFVSKPLNLRVLGLKVNALLHERKVISDLLTAGEVRRNLFVNVLRAMERMMDAKDGSTRSHAENVALDAVRIARQMGLSDDEAENVRLAASLHDFGKMGVQEAIIQKPGPLTDDEMKQMKRHPLIAATILEPIEDVEGLVFDIKSHHERYDGEGYPEGLTGEMIPLGARIIAVAEAFDVMTTEQPYAPARPVKDAMLDLQENAGSQFDPEVVRAFMDALEEDDRQ